MKKIHLLSASVILLLLPFEKVTAQMQLNNNDNPVTNHFEPKTFRKHEIGFSIGAFPTIGFIDFCDKGIVPFSGDPMFSHTRYDKRDDGNYIKMYHFGSYSLNYNYHFNSKRSLGGSISWVGKHVDRYWKYSPGWLSSADETIDGSGWKHYFTMQVNYRNTYYRKNDKIALYWGISGGITLCVRDKAILPKETLDLFLGTESNAEYVFSPAMQLNAFGMELGEKYLYHLELGIGTQGLLKTGFRYKF